MSLYSSTASLRSSIMRAREENGRKYHGYKDGKYVLPVDEVRRPVVKRTRRIFSHEEERFLLIPGNHAPAADVVLSRRNLKDKVSVLRFSPQPHVCDICHDPRPRNC